MQSIIKQLSKEYVKEMGLAPIEPGTMKQFQLCKAGVWMPAVERFVTPEGYRTPGRVMINDPFDKKRNQKMIFHYVDYEPEYQQSGGEDRMKGREEYIRFSGPTGVLSLDETKNEMFYFMMVHNKRRENPFRIKGIEAKWFLVDEKKDDFKFVASFEYEVLAGQFLQTAEDGELLTIGARLNSEKVYFVDLNKNMDHVKRDLVGVIKQSPMAFMLATQDRRFRVKVMLDTELADKNILWDEQKRHFYWRSTSAAICVVDKGNKPALALLDFACGKEGGKFFNELKIRAEKHDLVLI